MKKAQSTDLQDPALAKEESRRRAAASIRMGGNLVPAEAPRQPPALFSGSVIAILLFAALMMGFVLTIPHHQYMYDWGNALLDAR